MQSLIQTPSSSPTSSMTTMPGRITPIPESGRYTPVTSTPVKERGARESTAGSLERKVQTFPRRKISLDSRLPTMEKEKKTQRPTTPSSTTGSLGTKKTAVQGGQQLYIPPVLPPKKENWMPDQQVSICVICHEKFSMVSYSNRFRYCSKRSEEGMGWNEHGLFLVQKGYAVSGPKPQPPPPWIFIEFSNDANTGIVFVRK